MSSATLTNPRGIIPPAVNKNRWERAVPVYGVSVFNKFFFFWSAWPYCRVS